MKNTVHFLIGFFLLFLPQIISNIFLRQTILLLTDLIYFLACQENSNDDDALNVQIMKPNRNRQKLIREQNILRQVC